MSGEEIALKAAIIAFFSSPLDDIVIGSALAVLVGPEVAAVVCTLTTVAALSKGGVDSLRFLRNQQDESA